MPAKRKYVDPLITTMRIERKSKKIADALGILLSDALQIGLDVIIQTRMNDGDRRVTPEIVQEFIEVHKKNLVELKDYIHTQEITQQRLESMATIREDVKADRELIEVYDPDEEKKVQMTRKMARRLGLV